MGEHLSYTKEGWKELDCTGGGKNVPGSLQEVQKYEGL